MIKNYPTPLLIKTLPITLALYLVAGLWEIFIKGKISLGLTRFTALFWIIENTPGLLMKRNVIRKSVTKKGEEGMLNLLSSGTILSSFLSFVKAK